MASSNLCASISRGRTQAWLSAAICLPLPATSGHLVPCDGMGRRSPKTHLANLRADRVPGALGGGGERCTDFT